MFYTTLKYFSVILCIVALVMVCYVVAYAIDTDQLFSATLLMVCVGLMIAMFVVSTPRGELHDAVAAGVEEQAFWDNMADAFEEERRLEEAAWANEMAQYQALAYLEDPAHLAVDYSWMDGMTIDEADDVFKDIIGH